MIEIIEKLANTPVPTVLIIAGLFFLFVAVGGQFGAKIVTRRVRQQLAGIIGAFLLLIGLGLWICPTGTLDELLPKKVEVPNVVNMQQTIAEIYLGAKGLKVGNIETTKTDTSEPGIVLAQDPDSGAKVPEGEWVDLLVTAVPESVKVRYLVTLPLGIAQTVLIADNLQLGSVDTAKTDTAEPGIILVQNPDSGVIVLEGDSVDLVIAAESDSVIIPNVVNLSLEEAQVKLINCGLKLGCVDTAETVTTETVYVLGQNPEAEVKVLKGQAVDLTVASE